MVLKFETDEEEIYIIDATSSGVKLTKWRFLRDHVGPNKFYDKIILRHLNFDRNDQVVNNLEKFLSEAIGRKYGISSLFTRKETISKAMNHKKRLNNG